MKKFIGGIAVGIVLGFPLCIKAQVMAMESHYKRANKNKG